MPRYLLSLFVALAAPFLMATSCTLPAEAIHSSSALCAALGSPGVVCNDPDTVFYKSPRDGKWYLCRVDDSPLANAMQGSRCMNDPAKQVTDQQAAILDQWAAGNTSGSSTPPVSDPVFTDTPSSTPPPPPPPIIED